MRIKTLCVVLTLAAVGAVVFERKLTAQNNLKVTYGPNGIQQLSYNGVMLEDLAANTSDAFHIWHMKITDLTGNLLTTGQYGWGENHNSRTWDSTSHTWNYSYVWGSISVHFVQNGDTLDMNVTEVNSPSSGVILDGAVIYPFVLHFPRLPVGFTDQSYAQLAFNTTGPSVTLADFGTGEVASVFADASKPLYSGFQPLGQSNSYFPIISGTSLDGMAVFQPHNDRPVMPGQTDSFTVSLRFAPSGTATSSLATDAYKSWANTWPPQINWTDRRPIGTLYLSSAATGNINQPNGYPNNPRRYFNDSNAKDFDVTTASGLVAFQARVLQQAAINVTNLQSLHAQGAITWDLEGQQYPQETSYVCSPDQIAQVAPEMDSVITNSSSPYVGMKLDDAYFKIMRDAGFRVGVCIRPQHFTLNSDGTAQQVYLPNANVAAELIRKMKYAHDRWGATLFYVDSTVESDGAVLDAGIFQQVAAALPDSLIAPEESTPKYYAYTAPFRTFIFHGDLGTDPSVYNYYPKAFSLLLINDVDPGKLAAALTQITSSVREGDVLMTHVDYWQANNPTVLQIYQNAGITVTNTPPTNTAPAQGSTTPPATTPTPPPVTTPPAPTSTGSVSITTPVVGDNLSGQITVTAQINVNLDAAGSYLMVDGNEIGTRRVSSAPYAYPLDTAMLADGQHVLQLWAHDIANNTDYSQTVSITVSNGSSTTAPVSNPGNSSSTAPANTNGSTTTGTDTIGTVTDTSSSTPPTNTTTTTLPTGTPANPIALNYPMSGQAITGKISVVATIPQTLDAAGSYLMVDGVEVGTRRVGAAPYLFDLDTTALSAGTHILQIWAHDIGNNTLLSNQAQVTVSR